MKKMDYYNKYDSNTTDYTYYRDERTGKTYCIEGSYPFPPSYKIITKKEFEESKKNAWQFRKFMIIYNHNREISQGRRSKRKLNQEGQARVKRDKLERNFPKGNR